MEIVSDIQSNYQCGYIKLFRSLKNKGWYKKSDFVHLWIHILIKASHKQTEFWFNGKSLNLQAGQFVTGRKQLKDETGINESKIERILTYFEKIEHQIEQQKTSKNRLITILSWELYQDNEQYNEQPVNNKRTTSEQPVNTYKNVKNNKNDNTHKNIYADFLEKFNILLNRKFKVLDKKTTGQLNARLKEGFTIEDILKATENCSKDKYHIENPQYLTPEFITRTDKLQKYLNSKPNNSNGTDFATDEFWGTRGSHFPANRVHETE